MNNDLPKCTLCGEPATCMVRNFSREVIMNGRYKHEPLGEPEWRCKKHGVSTIYNIMSLYDPPSENTKLYELYSKVLDHVIEDKDKNE